MNIPAENEAPVRRPGRPPSPKLRERRRERILEEATAVFAEAGYAGADLEVVAARVGCAKGTVYRYFPSKRELFFAAVDRGMWALRAELDRAFGDGEPADAAEALARVEEAVRTYLRFFAERPELVELLMLERAEFRDREQPSYFLHREAAVEPWRALVVRLVELGLFRPVDPGLVTDLVSNLLYGTLFTNHFHRRAGDPRIDVERQVEEIRSLLLSGLLADAARPTETTP